MKYWPFYLATLIAVASVWYLTSNSSAVSIHTAETKQNNTVDALQQATRPKDTTLSPNLADNIQESVTTENTVAESQGNVDFVTKLCEETESNTCILKKDVSIIEAFYQDSTMLNSSAITVAITGENFTEVLNQLNQYAKNNEAVERYNEYQNSFNQFYQEVDGLLKNELACSENLCAATFSLSNEASFEDIVAKVDKATFKPNAHLFSSSGHDESGNFEARFIFSTTEQFTAISSN
jgi:hypothetical protein